MIINVLKLTQLVRRVGFTQGVAIRLVFLDGVTLGVGIRLVLGPNFASDPINI